MGPIPSRPCDGLPISGGCALGYGGGMNHQASPASVKSPIVLRDPARLRHRPPTKAARRNRLAHVR